MNTSMNASTLNASAIIEELNTNMTMAVLPVTIVIGVEAVVGFFGNILILLVYSRHYEQSNFRLFVLFMAVLDFTSCCTTLPGEIFSQMNWYTFKYGWVCKVKTFFNVVTAWGSASILLILAIDRNRKICDPLKWTLSRKMARKLCSWSIVMAFIAAMPALLLWGKHTYTIESNGMSLNVSICEKTNKYANTIYPFLYILIIYVIPVGLMIVVVSILNVQTATVLFGRRKTLVRIGTRKLVSSSALSLSQISMDTDSTMTSDGRMTPSPSFNTLTDICNPLDNKQTIDKNIGTVSTIQTPVSNVTRTCMFSTDFEDDVDMIATGVRRQRDQPHRIKDEFKGTTGNASIKKKTLDATKTRLASPASVSFVSNEARTQEVLRRKTVIMLVLTSMFAVTMASYIISTFLVSSSKGFLRDFSNETKVIFFIFWRLYFVNTNINPILYGIMDPRFRSGLSTLLRRKWSSGRS